MRKSSVILFCFIVSSCSVTRKNISPEVGGKSVQLKFIEQVKALNITNSDFNITKAEIEIRNDKEKQKMICNMKYQKPGKYLVSLKSQAGIEAARIFITEDTVMINDRINKKLYYGKPDYLLEKYGITTEILPIVLGDLIANISYDEETDCQNGETVLESEVDGKEIIYTIDCRKKKVNYIRYFNVENEKGIIIEYGKFYELEESTIPKNIRITDSTEETSIYIDIERIEKGLEKDITFIPGKSYEKILLR